MNKTQYLSEEKFQKVKKVLITIGCISLAVALVLLIASFLVDVPEMGEEGWFEAENLKTTLRFLAFPFGLMIPMVTFTSAFKREIIAFNVQQTMPVAQEGIEKMTPTVGVAAKEIAKGVKEGLKDEEK